MNCKYCGSETTEKDSYCPACGKPTGDVYDAADNVLEDSQRSFPENETLAADSTQGIADSTMDKISDDGCGSNGSAGDTADGKLQTTSTPGIKEILRNPPRSLKRAGRIIAIVLCCAALIWIGSCIRSKSLEGQLRRAKSDYSTAAAAIEELNSQLSDAQTELETVQAENDTLTGQVSSLNNQITTMEGDITQYQYDASAAQQDAEYAAGQVAALNETVTGLETDLAAANETNETLQADNDQLTEENETLSEEKETLEESNAALTDENEAYEEKVSFYDQYVVFVMVGDRDKYYHTYDCPEFTKKNFLAYSVKLAEQNNYTPCPVCHAGTTTATAAQAATSRTTTGGTNN